MELPEDKRVFYLQRPETACLIKYYGGICKWEFSVCISIGYSANTPFALAAADDVLFVRRSCAFGEFGECDELPDPVMPQLSFAGCKFCHTDLCNDSTRNALPQTYTLGIVLILSTMLLRN